MSLTGSPLVTLLVAMAVGFPLVLLMMAWRRKLDGRWRGIGTFVSVLLCQVLAVAAVGVAANNQFGFYNSWSEMLGQGNAARQVPTANGLVPSDGSQGRVLALPVPLPLGATGNRAGGKSTVLVWVPKEYGQPQYRSTTFPVTMMMPGQPSTAEGVFRQFDFAAQATRAIEQHQVKPFVAVFPPIMIAPPRDTECTDVPRGPQAETWLFRNVRNAVLHFIRVTPNGNQWSAMGWSTGGFCAAKLLLRHPALFHAAVGFGAYYDAETDKSTGDLFAGDQKLRNLNSPIQIIQKVRSQAARLLIIVSRVDRASYNGRFYADSKEMIALTRGMSGVATLVLPKGGHNYHTYRVTVPQALSWLGRNAGL